MDFVDKKLLITDKVTGQKEDVALFLAILLFSQYTYVQACRS
ncbi:MAG: hypothetical protein OXC92_07860 [Flavobacteriaceae bacterium]|nr:hypothetical protein [Flavobacteriaceae bacterium]MCY4216878.1 hypothetical protein [Flavobacteriaceae bacterium]MCY4253834.1 hypothetical protein [Flavobacteriaceae bacterium]